MKIERFRDKFFDGLTRYRWLDTIGRGGMGVVFKAQDLDLDEVVAIKVLSPEIDSGDESDNLVRRFKREINLNRKIKHPNVARIHDFGTSGDYPYITMEYVPGRDLSTLIRDEASMGLPPAEAVSILRQIALGTHAAHKQGIVHRDLKSSNIIVDGSGAVAILDFGLARGKINNELTMDAVILGTPHYMSPEQALGKPTTPQSDIYSIGIIAFELLTGGVPFTGESPIAIAMKHVTEPFPDTLSLHDDVPPELAAIVLKAVAKNAEERFESAADMEAELASLQIRRRADEPRKAATIAPMAALPKPPAAVPPRDPGSETRAVRSDAVAVARPAPLAPTAAATPIPPEVSEPESGPETWDWDELSKPSGAREVTAPLPLSAAPSPSPGASHAAEIPPFEFAEPGYVPPVAAPVASAPASKGLGPKVSSAPPPVPTAIPPVVPMARSAPAEPPKVAAREGSGSGSRITKVSKAPREARPSRPAIRRPPAILVVDEHGNDRAMLASAMARLKWQTLECASGPEALEIAMKSPIDLILMDVHLSGMDGFDVTRFIKSQPSLSGLPIVLMSHRLDRGQFAFGIQSGASDFLAKPAHPESVALRVWKILQHRGFESEEADAALRAAQEQPPYEAGLDAGGGSIWNHPAQSARQE